MKRFHRHSAILSCWLAVAWSGATAFAAEPALPRDLLEAGWIQLFDGQTLFGWSPVGEASWEVVDGAIRTGGEQPGFLMSTTEFADFELHLEFRAAAETNSGVFLRSAEEPTDPAKDCVELNIAPADNAYPTGSLVARQQADLPAAEFPQAGRWHTFAVTAKGNRWTVRLDGEEINHYEGRSPLRGHLGLQAKRGPIAFRNIRLRPLDLQPMLAGDDLAGWKTDQAGDSRFEITPAGELHMLGGRGQLESEAKYADFVMQLECKVRGDGLNSGVFFRSIPGDFQNGYESQISNATVDGDRSRPADHGTGGIFRRQEARRVVADDHRWFTKTIVADGPHMAIWVDGYAVTDWTDDRPADENPRRGQRVSAGTIILQGHDPTTDLLFRNLRIVELP